MDTFLYSIPVIGLVFEFIGYLIAILPLIAPITYQAAVPIAFAALCGVMCERSGVVNIGIEGTMLVAAFVGWTAGIYLVPVVGSNPTPFFGASPALVIALILALLAAVLVSAIHAWLSISVKADQIISGTIINIAALGITGYLNTLLAKSSPTGAGQFPAWTPPKFLTDLPVVGWLFSTFLAQGPITTRIAKKIAVAETAGRFQKCSDIVTFVRSWKAFAQSDPVVSAATQNWSPYSTSASNR
jgi:simple sugar transport system permease protein